MSIFELRFAWQSLTKSIGFNTLFNLKYFNEWKDSLKNPSSPLKKRRPWITFRSKSIIDKYLKNKSAVFEYGGGGSTLYFLDKGAEVTTVEHNEIWFDELSKIISAENLSNLWTGKLMKPELRYSHQEVDFSDPNNYLSSESEFQGRSFFTYVSTIDGYLDNSFDVVLIDGRCRPSCIKHSVSKVKVGGILVLDNTEREYYLQKTNKFLEDFELVLDNYGPTPGLPWFTKTSIWKRKF